MLEGGWLGISEKICDALTGDELRSFDHKHIVRSCSFSEDTHLLLTGGFEKILRICDLNCPDAPPQEAEKSSPGSVRTVAWLHSDQTILSSCSDSGGVRAEVSKDGRYITTAYGSSVKLWDANHFGLVKSYDMSCTVESASLEPKFGNKFIVVGEDMWIHLFDFNTGEEIVQSTKVTMVQSIMYGSHREVNHTYPAQNMEPLEYSRHHHPHPQLL
ncbi:hypothetical protein Lser_V15G30193 [Lactuca serriola]